MPLVIIALLTPDRDLLKNSAKNLLIEPLEKLEQTRIPTKSIARIISRYKQGRYDHVALNIQTFKDQKSWDVLGQVHKDCDDMGIILLETNDALHLYPTKPEELVEHCDDNLPLIRERLGLPKNAPENEILNLIYATSTIPDFSTVVARRFDMGKGKKNYLVYLVFMDMGKKIGLYVEKRVVKAGRANHGGPVELHTEYGKDESYLIITPENRAFIYPAQIRHTEGVDITDKPLRRVIFETGKEIGSNSSIID